MFETLGSQINLMGVFAVWSRDMRWRPLSVRPAAGCSSASPWQSGPRRRRFWRLRRRFRRRRHQRLRSPSRFAHCPRERHLRRRRRQQLCRSGELAELAGRHGTDFGRSWPAAMRHGREANWLPSTMNASQFFFMRLLKDKLPCDVATTWTFSHWCRSDGLHALPAAGSTAWDLPLSRTRKPQ